MSTKSWWTSIFFGGLLITGSSFLWVRNSPRGGGQDLLLIIKAGKSQLLSPLSLLVRVGWDKEPKSANQKWHGGVCCLASSVPGLFLTRIQSGFWPLFPAQSWPSRQCCELLIFFNNFFVWWVHPESVSTVGCKERSLDLSQDQEQQFLMQMLAETLDTSYTFNWHRQATGSIRMAIFSAPSPKCDLE